MFSGMDEINFLIGFENPCLSGVGIVNDDLSPFTWTVYLAREPTYMPISTSPRKVLFPLDGSDREIVDGFRPDDQFHGISCMEIPFRNKLDFSNGSRGCGFIKPYVDLLYFAI